MSISFVGSYVGGFSSTSDQTIAFSNLRNESGVEPTLQEGDVVLVCVATSCNASVNDSYYTPSGYTAVNTKKYQDASSYDTAILVSRKTMGSTPDTSVVIPGNVSGLTFAKGYLIYVLRGVDTSTPMDVSATTAGGSDTTQADCSAITPATAGAMVLMFYAGACNVNVSYDQPSGTSTTTNHFRTQRVGGGAGNPVVNVAGAIYTGWTSGSYDPAAVSTYPSSAAGTSWASVTLALRPLTAISASPGNAAHEHTASSPSLLPNSVTVPADASHAHAATSPSITAQSTVTVDSAGHGVTDTAPPLMPNSTVPVDDALHGHAAGTPAISTRAQVEVNSTDHAHVAGTPSLASMATLSINFAYHGHEASVPSIAARSEIAPSGTTHEHAASTPDIFAQSAVSPFGAYHAHAAQSPSMGTVFSVSVDAASHELSGSEPTIGFRSTVSPNVASHAHLASEPVLAGPYQVFVDAGFHILSSTSPGILTASSIAIDSCLHTHVAGVVGIFISLPTPESRTIIAGGMSRLLIAQDGARWLAAAPTTRLLP